MAARRYIPAVPKTQALKSTTFQSPPLDGSLTVAEICDWHGIHSPEHPVFRFAQEDGSIHTLSWGAVAMAVLCCAELIRERICRPSNAIKVPIIAILASSDTIPYATTILGILRASYVVFPISMRNSPVAVAHLLNQVGVDHILVGREQPALDLLNASLECLSTTYSYPDLPSKSILPIFDDIYLRHDSRDYESKAHKLVYQYEGPDSPGMILHSSGSTAFPKPIIFTNHRLIQSVAISCYAESDSAEEVMAIHMCPMFHAMGIIIFLRTLGCGMTCGVFAPRTSPPIPTSDTVMKASQDIGSTTLMTTPAMLEDWSKNPRYVQWLASLDGVSYGGSPLNKEVGDYLSSQGVRLVTSYGSTETGRLSMLSPAKHCPDWEYFRFNPALTIKLEPYGPDTYELIVVSNATNTPSVFNTTVDGVEAYATSDLIACHPTWSGYWKIIGRTDDQIMHSTGEKTNPGPLESILMQDPHVLSCVMFGRGRFQAGILIEPKPEYAFDPSDAGRLAQFRTEIWPTVEKVNAYAPRHSRLFKEMILIASPSKPFTFGAKGIVRRQQILTNYEAEIEEAYEHVEESAQPSILSPSHWDEASTLQFVRAVVGMVLKNNIANTDDFFQHACDSLQATWIRNTILRVLRDSARVDTRKIPSNFVYENPTIAQLSTFIANVACGAIETSSPTTLAARVDAMNAMVSKYSADFPVIERAKREDQDTDLQPRDVVLLTGTTGSLGCYTLARLVSDPVVRRVYAVNRSSKDGKALRQRQTTMLIDRGLDAGIVDSAKVVLLEADVSGNRFGLSEEIYAEMQQSVTHIIHNAWRVDFNVALASFEPNVKGLRNLIDFALSSPLSDPPPIIFTSSIGIFQNVELGSSLAEAPTPPDFTVGMGYAESKWVSEQILYNACHETDLNVMIVRVGQITGGLDGAWNAHEWFPALVQSAPRLGCFPDDDGGVAWIPLEITASALAELRHASNETHTVHLVHPRPVSWHKLASIISSHFHVPLVPYVDWLARLEDVARNNIYTGESQTHALGNAGMIRTLRALQLLPMFRGIGAKLRAQAEQPDGHGGTKLALGKAELEVVRAVAASPTLGDPEIRQVDEDDVKRWIAYWQRVGLFDMQ